MNLDRIRHYTEKTDGLPVDLKAYEIIEDAFEKVTDRQEAAYVLHCLRVGAAFQDNELRAIGYLHDLVEDTDWTLDELSAVGFPRRVVSGVDSVTRRDGESYEEFIVRCSFNRDGRLVKLSDMGDNTRPGWSREKNRRRYAYARSYLEAVEAGRPITWYLEVHGLDRFGKAKR